MKIIDLVDRLEALENRAGDEGWGTAVKIIGHITEDKWFDYDTFFEE